MHVFSFTIMTYMKKFIGMKSLTKQCPSELSPTIMHSPPVSHGLYPPPYQKTAKRLIWASFFSVKNNFIFFFKRDYLILIYYLKNALKIYFDKL